MVTAVATPSTMTFLKGIQKGSNFNTTSNTYVDVTTLTMANVPNGSKIYFAFSLSKAIAGTMSARLTDGTNVFWEETGIVVGGFGFSSLDGSVTQNSGGAATVKLQILSSDANTATVQSGSNGIPWFCCTDADHPIVVFPEEDGLWANPSTIKYNGKRHINTLKGFKATASDVVAADFAVAVSGLYIKTAVDDTLTDQSIDLGLMTTEIEITPSSTNPTWTASRGEGGVIVGYDGFHIEVTG